MAQYQNQCDEVRQTDEYGKPVDQMDEYGNPIRHHTGTTDGEYGSGTTGYGAATTEAEKYGTGNVGYGTATTEAGKYGGTPGSAGTDIGREYNKEQPGKLHRSGSSGSSSSEDDGQAGRRKKGTKEKLPGTGRHRDDPSYATSATLGGYDSAEQHQEKKGIMDKIKEKLPGHRNDDN